MDKPQPNISSHGSLHKRTSIPVAPLVAILLVVVIYLASMVFGQVIYNLYISTALQAGQPVDPAITESTLVQFMYIAVVEAATVAMLYVFMHIRNISFADLGLVRPRLHDFGVTLLAYVPYFVINGAATLGAAALFHINTDQKQQIGFMPTQSTTDLILTFVSLAILPPLVEEIVTRGFLFTSLRSRMSVLTATLLTSFIFALPHLQIGSGAKLLYIAAIDTFVLSLVLCYLRFKTGSLWAGIGLHAVKNSLAFAVIFLGPHLPSFMNM